MPQNLWRNTFYCYLVVHSQITDLFILLTNVCKRVAVYVRVHTYAQLVHPESSEGMSVKQTLYIDYNSRIR